MYIENKNKKNLINKIKINWMQDKFRKNNRILKLIYKLICYMILYEVKILNLYFYY